MILYTIMYKQAIINSLIKCATGSPTPDDYLSYIHLTRDIGDAMNSHRVKGMPITLEKDPLKYTVDISDKTLKGKPTISSNPSDPASVSLLLGRAARDSESPFLLENGIGNFGWTWRNMGRTIDMLKSFGDAKRSWAGIEKAYKDHPDIIKDFEYLRNKRIPAKLKADLANTLPGLLGGGYLGYKWFTGKRNLFDKKKHPILYYLTKGVKGLAGLSLGGLLATGAAHLLGLPQYYNSMYEQAVNDPSYVYRSNRLNQNILKLHESK